MHSSLHFKSSPLPFQSTVPIIEVAQAEMRRRLAELERCGGLTRERYVRYLSMQFHLTRGVQRYFLGAAGHPDVYRYPQLRKFLIAFAQEEEPHYRVAEADLRRLGAAVLPEPFDVELWHSYFRSNSETSPFLRLGAACVLENIAGGSADVIDRLFRAATYLDKRNTVFVTIHRHGPDVAHGEQILDAIASAALSDAHAEDLRRGAARGALLYLRLVDWALDTGDRGEMRLLELSDVQATGGARDSS